MNTIKRVFAVGKVVPVLGPIIVTEEDALGPVGWTEFVEGIEAATRGADLAEMTTADAVAGWWWATQRNNASEPDEAIEDDYEDIRRGL